MAFRSFEEASLSRRALFRSSAYLAAGSALATLPMGRALLAHDVSDAWPNVAAKIEQYVSQRKVPNMVVAFGKGTDAPHSIARGVLKFGGSTKANLDSLYRIYSMTKPVTGMAAMILVDEGKLELDQPISDLLPKFAKMRVLTKHDGPLENTVPAERPITVRHLLTHTAGFGYDIISKGPIRQAYVQRGVIGGQISRMPIPGIFDGTAAPGLATWADRLAELPLIAQPGTAWNYSVSLDLLGRLIEVASGQSFGEFLKQRIFNPCGMSSTYFQVPESEIHRFTDNYGIAGGIPLPIDPARASIYLDNPPIEWGGAGLVSSPNDYDRFLKMLLGYGVIDGERVMEESAVRLGISNLLPEGVNPSHPWIGGQGFGAGGRIVDGAFSWGGAAGTLASVDYRNNLRAGLYVQYMPSDAYPIRDEFLEALAKDIARVREAQPVG